MEDKEETVLEDMRKAGKPVGPKDVADLVSLPKRRSLQDRKKSEKEG